MGKTIVLFFCSTLLLSSCKTLTNTSGLEKPHEEDRWQKPSADGMSEEQKLAYVEEILEELINAVEDDDFRKYSRHFVRDIKDLMTESEFKTRNSEFKEQCGDYVSREFIGVLEKQLFDVYLWKARYSKLPNDDILLRLFVVEENGRLGIYAFNIQPF